MRRENKSFNYTAEEIAEQVEYWQTSLKYSRCTEPDSQLTAEQERLLGLLIEFLQVAEAEEEALNSDCFDFDIRHVWNNEKKGCTVRISENFNDRLAYIKLNDVEKMLAAHKAGEAAMTVCENFNTACN